METPKSIHEQYHKLHAFVRLRDKQWSLFAYVTSNPLARASSSPVADLKNYPLIRQSLCFSSVYLEKILRLLAHSLYMRNIALTDITLLSGVSVLIFTFLFRALFLRLRHIVNFRWSKRKNQLLLKYPENDNDPLQGCSRALAVCDANYFMKHQTKKGFYWLDLHLHLNHLLFH